MRMDDYISVLDRIKRRGYTTVPFAKHSEQYSVQLRHDVDINPKAALHMATREKEEGYRSAYFFHLDTDAYNIFDVRPIITAIGSKGHRVGLHIDERKMGTNETKINATILWFRNVVAPVDQIISFHRPTEDVLGLSYDALQNAYGPKWWSRKSYVSDAGGVSEGFHAQLHEMMNQRLPLIQLNTHPVWWSSDKHPVEISSEKREQRIQEIEKYWKDNFSKV